MKLRTVDEMVYLREWLNELGEWAEAGSYSLQMILSPTTGIGSD
jgi:hypothetical protein